MPTRRLMAILKWSGLKNPSRALISATESVESTRNRFDFVILLSRKSCCGVVWNAAANALVNSHIGMGGKLGEPDRGVSASARPGNS